MNERIKKEALELCREYALREVEFKKKYPYKGGLDGGIPGNLNIENYSQLYAGLEDLKKKYGVKDLGIDMNDIFKIRKEHGLEDW